MSSAGHYADFSNREFEDKEGTLNNPEPPPIKNNNPAVWDLVIADMQERDRFGTQKYNTRLQPFNGRDALVDVYQEQLDGIVYFRQLIFERQFEKAVIENAVALVTNLNSNNDEELFKTLTLAVKNLLDAQASARVSQR